MKDDLVLIKVLLFSRLENMSTLENSNTTDLSTSTDTTENDAENAEHEDSRGVRPRSLVSR